MYRIVSNTTYPFPTATYPTLREAREVVEKWAGNHSLMRDWALDVANVAIVDSVGKEVWKARKGF